MTLRILALDIATCSGWTVLERRPEGWHIDGIGTIDVTPKQGEPMGVRFHAFREKLRDIIDLYGPVNAVAIEDNHSRSFHAAKLQGGFLAVALVEIEEMGVDYAMPTVGEWKKHVVGAGNAKKPAVRKALNGRLGITPASTLTLDESDSLGIALWLIDTALADEEAA